MAYAASCFVFSTQNRVAILRFFTKSVDTQSSQCYYPGVQKKPCGFPAGMSGRRVKAGDCTEKYVQSDLYRRKEDSMYFSTGIIVISIISVLLVGRLVRDGFVL